MKNDSEFGINFKKGGEFLSFGLKNEEDEMKIDFIENLSFENYQNSILKKYPIIEKEAQQILNRSIRVKSYPNLYQLKSDVFNKSEKIIKYKKKPNINEILNFDINAGYDKSFLVVVRIKDHVTNKEVAFTSL